MSRAFLFVNSARLKTCRIKSCPTHVMNGQKAMKNISYGIKLPAALVAISLIVVSVSSFIQLKRFENTMIQAGIDQLATITEERAQRLSEYFERVSNQTASFANYPAISNAARMLDATYQLIEDPTATLHQSYINENPFAAGERQLLNNAGTGQPYDRQHESYHNYFTSFRDELNLYDVFLINPQGDVIYSVYKELDFATNLLDGPYSDSGLAMAFRSALEAEEGQPVFADFRPYEPSADAPASFIAFPVIDEFDQRIGVLAVQLPASDITSVVNSPNGLGLTGEVTAIGNDRRARTNSRFEGRYGVFDEIKTIDEFLEAQAGEMIIKPNILGINGKQSIETGRIVPFLGTQWAVIAELERSELLAPVNQARMIAIGVIVASLIIMSLAGWLIARSFTKPLSILSANVGKLSKKDFSIVFDQRNQSDEIGTLSAALVELKDAVQKGEDLRKTQQTKSVEQARAIDLMSQSLSRLSNGDLSCPIEEEMGSDYERLRTDYNAAIARLNETLSSITDISETIEGRAANIRQSSENLSTDANMQAATLEESVAAIDELAATARQNLDSATTVRGLVLDAKTDVDHNSGVVDETIQAMENLRKSSEEISAIIGLIEDISFQTNLLALNAGVEAARAGESGKGFAVVAAEVRALAQRSSDAAAEIKSLVTESTKQVETGVKLVGETSGVISTVFKKVDQVNEQMKTVSEAVSEQTSTVENLNAGMAQLDQVTQRNATMVDSFASGSQELEKQAQGLSKAISQFTLGGQPRRTKTITQSPPVPASAADPIDSIERMIDTSSARDPKKAIVSGNLAEKESSIWDDF